MVAPSVTLAGSDAPDSGEAAVEVAAAGGALAAGVDSGVPEEDCWLPEPPHPAVIKNRAGTAISRRGPNLSGRPPRNPSRLNMGAPYHPWPEGLKWKKRKGSSGCERFSLPAAASSREDSE